MKNASLIAAIFFLLITGLIGQNPVTAGEPANSCMDQLRQKIVENLKYPEYAHKTAIQGEVTLIFSISDEKIIVKNISASDVYLGTYVREQVSGIRCSDFTQIKGKDYRIKIRFTLK